MSRLIGGIPSWLGALPFLSTGPLPEIIRTAECLCDKSLGSLILPCSSMPDLDVKTIFLSGFILLTINSFTLILTYCWSGSLFHTINELAAILFLRFNLRAFSYKALFVVIFCNLFCFVLSRFFIIVLLYLMIILRGNFAFKKLKVILDICR